MKWADEYKGDYQLYYLVTSDEPEAGDFFGTDALRQEDQVYPGEVSTPVIVPSLLEAGDYVPAGMIGESNVEVFSELTDGLDGVWQISGDAGYEGIAIRADLADPVVLELLGRLENYSILDEDHYSELVYEKRSETMELWAERELVNELQKRAVELGEDDEYLEIVLDQMDDQGRLTDALMYQLIPLAESKGAHGWSETVEGATLDARSVAEALDWNDITDTLDMSREQPRAPQDPRELIQSFIKGKVGEVKNSIHRGVLAGLGSAGTYAWSEDRMAAMIKEKKKEFKVKRTGF